MAAAATLIAAIDRVIEYFNKRTLDLPDGLFDRRTQFVINGAPFETLLGRSPDDPLILMLARGPAGFRFTTKALQHAVPDVKAARGEISGDRSAVSFDVRITGTLRGTAEAINTVATMALKLAAAGHVEVAEAAVDPVMLDKIRAARLRA